MQIERVPPAERLRIAVLADFEGPHARAWLRWPVARGHDVHAISFYAPSAPIDGVTVHALRGARSAAAAATGAVQRGSRAPRGILRLAHAARYRAAGLAGAVRRIAPDVLHAHFLVEHGFYGTVAGERRYVTTAWGSDVLVEPERDAISRQIARWTVRRSRAVTSNNAWMAQQIVAELGAAPQRVHVVTLGAERFDLERAADSVNRAPPDAARLPVVLSTRAHEPLYNIACIIDACAQLVRAGRALRLVVAHEGPLTAALRARAADAGIEAEFAGFLDRVALRDAFAAADVYVSVPSSDATSVAVLQAMAGGAFPVLSDLPTQRELVEHGVNGLLVPPGDPAALASAIGRALDDAGLRRRAADQNLRIVEERGLNETQMLRLESIYRKVARG